MNVNELNINLTTEQKTALQSVYDTAIEEDYDLIDYLIYELIERDDIFDDSIRFRIIRETYIVYNNK